MAPAILNALPSFARKQNINCFSCYCAPGYTRDFGMNYKLNGYRTEAEIGEINETTQLEISDLAVLDKTFPISAKDALGNDILNASDNSVLRLTLDIFF